MMNLDVQAAGSPQQAAPPSGENRSSDEQQPHPILSAAEIALMDPMSSDEEIKDYKAILKNLIPPSGDEDENDLVIDKTVNDSPVAEAVETPELIPSCDDKKDSKVDYREKYKVKKNPAGKFNPAKVRAENKMIRNADRPPLLDDPTPAKKICFITDSPGTSYVPPPSNKITPRLPTTPQNFRSPKPPFNSHQVRPTPVHAPGPPVFDNPSTAHPHNEPIQDAFPLMGGDLRKPEEPQFFSGSFDDVRENYFTGQHSQISMVYQNNPSDPRRQPSNRHVPGMMRLARPNRGVLVRPPLKRSPVRTDRQPAKAAIDSLDIEFKCDKKIELPDISEKLRRREPLTRKEEEHVKNNQKFFKDVKRIKTKFDFKVVSNFFGIF